MGMIKYLKGKFRRKDRYAGGIEEMRAGSDVQPASLVLRRLGTMIVDASAASDAKDYKKWTDGIQNRSIFPSPDCESLPFQYESVIEPGFDPQDKKNSSRCQDDIILVQNCGEKKDCTLVCVFDGHGPNGGRVAAWLCRNLLKIVRKNSLPEIPMQDVFTTSFEVAHDQITRSGVDVSMSGSTGLLCMLDKKSMHIGWAGDCRAVIGFCGDDGVVRAKALTTDHKPGNPTEKARIEAYGGMVGIAGDDIDQVERLFDADKFKSGHLLPGLSLSRAIGNADATELGLVSTPDYVHHDINQKADRFLLMATDGLWDVFDNDEVVRWVDDYVKSKTKDGILPGHEGNCDGVLLACQELALEAQRRWIDKFQKELTVDDVSISIVWIVPTSETYPGIHYFVDNRNAVEESHEKPAERRSSSSKDYCRTSIGTEICEGRPHLE
mmetsp:Transcript_15621/g.26313  ORF Transcript_15621/g.26313 Transcript_15621/m.26313 type:complete len:438 (+) Transcript_15621:80-1393(+)